MTTETLTRIQPLLDRVIGQKMEEEKKVKGIILPDSAKKESQLIKVIAVGPGRRDKEGNLIEMPVQEGDIVVIEKYAGQEITLDDQEYVITKAEEIVAKVQQ